MSGETKQAPFKPTEKERRADSGASIAIGTALGLVFGTALGNIAVGVILGLLLGTLWGAYQEMKLGRRHAGLALAITIVGLLIVLFILVLS